MQLSRRQAVLSMALLPQVAACEPDRREQVDANATAAQKRFKGMGAVLVVDAVPGAVMYGVEMFADDAVRPFYGKSAQQYRDTMAYPGGVLVPMKVRVVWREDDRGAQIGWGSGDYYDDQGQPRAYRLPPPEERPLWDPQEEIAKRKRISANTGVVHHGPWGSNYGGRVLGDHTLPIASRIPDDFAAALKANKGALRLKFRLKPDGVLFGWDIETRTTRPGTDYKELKYLMPGGDFLDTSY
jgi:hypothetical protein